MKTHSSNWQFQEEEKDSKEESKDGGGDAEVEEDAEEEKEPNLDEKFEAKRQNKAKRLRFVESQEDLEKFNLFDVVMPVPGHSISVPKNPQPSIGENAGAEAHDNSLSTHDQHTQKNTTYVRNKFYVRT